VNNEVRNARGEVIGFRCFVCDKVKTQMWGEICNECRERQEQHDELVKAISTANS
jgi:hypothetical protein